MHTYTISVKLIKEKEQIEIFYCINAAKRFYY